MNYISIINRFWDYATTNPLPTGQVALYFALVHINNKCNWSEWFQAPNQVLSVLTGMSRSGILKARNELKQRGLIDFRERGTKATIYQIIANSVQDSKQDSVQVGVQVGKQDSVQDSNTLNKQRNRLKQNNIPPISPAERFNDFFTAYPKQKNIIAAEKEYNLLLFNDQSLTEQELIIAAENYSDAVCILGTDEQYIKNPDRFLKDGTYLDYLDPNYTKPKPPAGKRNANTGIMLADYGDLSELEKELLSN